MQYISYVVCCLQYYADANEAESWMKEKMPLVCSDDYGKDEAAAQVSLSPLSVCVPCIQCILSAAQVSLSPWSVFVQCI